MKSCMYLGKVCKKCGSRIRYISERRCVQCKSNGNRNLYQRKKVLERHEVI